jgi:hypothetical protein
MTHADLYSLGAALGRALKGKEGPKVVTTESAVSVKEDGPIETILDEAKRLVANDRGADYGHPSDAYAPVGRIWGAILKIPDIPPATVCLMMAAMKIGRHSVRRKRDNLVDVAGYARTVEMCEARDACCCGAPNDTQAKHSVDACVGQDSAVGSVRPMTAAEIQDRIARPPRLSILDFIDPMPTKPVIPETFEPAKPAAPSAVEAQARMTAAQARINRILEHARALIQEGVQRVTVFTEEEGNEACLAYSRLWPDNLVNIAGYRYLSPAGRVVYIVAVRDASSLDEPTAIGSSVLQPGDKEDRRLGLQIAVGQALKNFARERFYGRSRFLSRLTPKEDASESTWNAYKGIVPPIAEEEIKRADARKRARAREYYGRTSLGRFMDDIIRGRQ